MGIITVWVVVFLILCVICAFKESKVTGTYKALGVYGRVKAYLALDFTFAGLAMAVMGIVSLVSGEIGAAGALGSMAFGLVLAVLGVWIYYSTWHKCPEVLKSRYIISMLITGLGVSLKVSIFFLGFVWKLVGPTEVTDENGNTLYVIDGNVYDGGGTKVGVVTENNGSDIKFVRV